MSEAEILYEEGCEGCKSKGWYGYRPWGYAGEFLFKSYKAHCAAPVIYSQWVRFPAFSLSSEEVEYFDTKAEVEALVCKLKGEIVEVANEAS